MKTFDIDLVYLWCDGNDADFVQKKRERMQQCGACNTGNENCRYIQIDELKYSLRSVVKYMPWIHHIYIVTNNQVPKWLKTHEKITIVDHSEILPETARPCFNSQALECCLHKIPNLAEHFIYANDDCFAGRMLSPSFFFDRNQRPIVLLKKCRLSNGLYDKTIIAAENYIEDHCGLSYKGYVPHHNMDAYTKTILTECEKEFENAFHHTIHQPFRTESCMQRYLFHLYGLAKKQAILKDVSRTFLQRVMQKLGIARLDSLILNNHESLKPIMSYNPALFCINDTERATDKDRARTLQFLERKFPRKSPFEKDA